MRNFKRRDTDFSLCGLNCALCPMKVDHYCPGCGGGPGNQPCAIASCSLDHQRVEYCYFCHKYPCRRYQEFDRYDSFITHWNQRRDMETAKRMGAVAYHGLLREKRAALRDLLNHYNDGRRKRFYCLAVNLLDIHDVLDVMEQVTLEETGAVASGGLPATLKERAARCVALLRERGAARGIPLRLRKKGE